MSAFTDEYFMMEAINEAKKAGMEGDVPVGAIIVRGDEIISMAHNTRENGGSAINHAEILAIDIASKQLGTWRLSDCTLYVTLEPCPMCAGAVINSRISKVVYGAKDAKAGALGSLIDLTSYPFNHKPICISGVLENECKNILKDFFAKKR
ncbi:MAG: tRNA adenosine(34) deaminase TadA [Clostridia bacterium]|nr:tRNA adenosine(34) deaminase TadA [Clostridia bacterium]